MSTTFIPEFGQPYWTISPSRNSPAYISPYHVSGGWTRDAYDYQQLAKGLVWQHYPECKAYCDEYNGCIKYLDDPADKRFLVFKIEEYYPSGGMLDLQQSFDSLLEAMESIPSPAVEYYQIYDRVVGKLVEFESTPATPNNSPTP